MEMNQLKEIWLNDNQKVERLISLNYQTIRELNLDKAVREYEKLMDISLAGRNMALVYGTISFVWAAFIFTELAYSIPLIISGIAMVWSFYHHLALDKPKDYYGIPVVELQKSIYKFRVHSSSSMKYDIGIVVLWILTIFTIAIKTLFHIPIYEDTLYLILFIVAVPIVSFIFISIYKPIYQQYEQKLQKAEKYLEEIIEFEK